MSLLEVLTHQDQCSAQNLFWAVAMSSSLHRVAMATWICSQHSTHGEILPCKLLRGTSSLGENVTLFSSPISFLDTCWHQQTSLISRTFLLDGRWWVWYRNLSCGNGCHSPVEIMVCILLHVSNSWKDAENSNLEQLKGLCWLLGTIFLPPRAIAAFKAPCSEKTIRKRWFSLSVGVLWVAGDISLTGELLLREGSWCCHL